MMRMLLLALALVSSSAYAQPNIVIIVADDLGHGDLGSYGGVYPTPNLDRLAAEGVRFTQAYSAATVCSPSRAGLLTGIEPRKLGIHHIFTSNPAFHASWEMPNYLDPDVPTLADVLGSAGYVTAMFGKWHLGETDDAPPPSAYGFHLSRTVHSNGGPTWDEAAPWWRASSSARIVDAALSFVRNCEAHCAGRPWYVQLSLLYPHAPIEPSAPQMERCWDWRVLWHPEMTSPAQVYCTAVTAVDIQVGRLVDAIDAMGLGEDTLIVFTSDNGPEDITVSNARQSGVGSVGALRGRKRSLYEGGIRVPLLVRWPGMVPSGVVSDAVVSHLDLMPSLSALGGAVAPLGLDGEDATDALLDAPWERSTALHWQWRGGWYGESIGRSPAQAVRDGDWKLLADLDGVDVELHHLPSDPMEVDDRAMERPDVLQRMMMELP